MQSNAFAQLEQLTLLRNAAGLTATTTTANGIQGISSANIPFGNYPQQVYIENTEAIIVKK